MEEADRRAAEADDAFTEPAGGEDQAQFGEPSAGFSGELELEAEDFVRAAEDSGFGEAEKYRSLFESREIGPETESEDYGPLAEPPSTRRRVFDPVFPDPAIPL